MYNSSILVHKKKKKKNLTLLRSQAKAYSKHFNPFNHLGAF